VAEHKGSSNKISKKSFSYKFKSPSLLEQALTHRSFANEHPEFEPSHNERLEFLGDAVLNLVLTDLLLKKHPSLSEGALSRLRAGLVNEKKLAQMALLLDLGDRLRIGRGEELTGGREKPSLLADTFEAVTGAIFLDGGFKSAFHYIARLFKAELEDNPEQSTCDYKTLLQEYCQGKFKNVPVYQVLKEEGPDHNKIFFMAVKVTDRVVCTGKGKTKKEAQQKAAREALFLLEQPPQDLG
jgi:ribonuclease III